MKRFLLMLLSFILIVTVQEVYSQINIGKKIENKVKNRVNNKVDKGIDKGLDAVEKDIRTEEWNLSSYSTWKSNLKLVT